MYEDITKAIHGTTSTYNVVLEYFDAKVAIQDRYESKIGPVRRRMTHESQRAYAFQLPRFGSALFDKLLFRKAAKAMNMTEP